MTDESRGTVSPVLVALVGFTPDSALEGPAEQSGYLHLGDAKPCGDV